jgi:hypothetical protein
MTGFYNLIAYLANAVGVSVEMVFIIALFVPCLLFYAADFKVGIISTFIILGGLFMYFYQFGFQTDRVIILMLMTVVILAFTLYFVSAKSQRQGLGIA